MIICPACGSSVEGQLCLGCPACGARAVGPPLAKPEHQLVSFGPAILAALGGGVMLIGFLASTTVVWIVSKGAALSLGTIVASGQTAAWQLKWISVPVAIAVIWGGWRSLRTIRKSPADFGGLRLARSGFSAAIIATLLVATLVGVTVPERLRRHQWALEAATKARGYALHRALLEYRTLHGTYPSDPDKIIEALRTVPDPDGSIAEALKFVSPNGYRAGSMVAVASLRSKPTLGRGNTFHSDSVLPVADRAPVSFTSYELRLKNEDVFFSPDDVFIVRDGLITTVPVLPVVDARRNGP